ncbi:hypothetical protein TWF696_007551 [Orbilia brochopaga]|uniref:Uncharacterized protein n=1 Tax=Orbilia brochopaga TaxID=3140254 RepID=A0AAV9UNU9_9PEZI
MKLPLLLVSCSALALGFPIGKPPWLASVDIVENQKAIPQTAAVLPSAVYEPVVQSTQVSNIDKRAPFFGFRFHYYGAGIGPYRGYYRRRSEGSFRYSSRQRTTEHGALSSSSEVKTFPAMACTSKAAMTTDTSDKKTKLSIDRSPALGTHALATMTTIRISVPTTVTQDVAATSTSEGCSECGMPGPLRGRPYPQKRAIQDRKQNDTFSSNSHTTRDSSVIFAASPALGLPPKYTMISPETSAVATPVASTTSITVSGPTISVTVSGPTVTMTVTVSERLNNPPIRIPPPTVTSTTGFKTTSISTHRPRITSTSSQKPRITTKSSSQKSSQTGRLTRPPVTRVSMTPAPTSTTTKETSTAELLTRPPLNRGPNFVAPTTRVPIGTMTKPTSSSGRPTATIIRHTPTAPAPTPTDTPSGDDDHGFKAPVRPFYAKRRARGRCERYPDGT